MIIFTNDSKERHDTKFHFSYHNTDYYFIKITLLRRIYVTITKNTFHN